MEEIRWISTPTCKECKYYLKQEKNCSLARCRYLRIDTHGDNIPMQNLLKKLGFTQRGVIHVQEDNDPRLAYDKIRE